MFGRVPFSEDGKLAQPLRAGAGLVANVAVKNYNAEADATLTVVDIGGGVVHQGLTLTSDVTYTLPTSTLIDAAFASMDVGDAFSFIVTNAQSAAFDVIIAVGAGMTAIGTNNSLTVSPQASRVFHLIKTAANTFDLY